MDEVIKERIREFYVPNKTAILLSGGMDSAILASYLPKGTPAYTFNVLPKAQLMRRKKRANTLTNTDLNIILLK